MRGILIVRSVALAASLMLAGSCTVGPDDTNTAFGGPVSGNGPGGDTATSQDQSTGSSASGAATSQDQSTGSMADETADASSSATVTGGSTSAGSSGDATTNVTSMGSSGGEPVCDEFCNGCACPSDMCTMCCAALDKVDQCVAGSCFCF